MKMIVDLLMSAVDTLTFILNLICSPDIKVDRKNDPILKNIRWQKPSEYKRKLYYRNKKNLHNFILYLYLIFSSPEHTLFYIFCIYNKTNEKIK